MIRSEISGDAMIFRNEKGFYSTTYGKKKLDGEWENAFLSVIFKKGTDIPNKTMITIKKGFWTFDNYISKKDNSKKTEWKLFILDYEIKNKNKQTETLPDVSDDDDLPF